MREYPTSIRQVEAGQPQPAAPCRVAIGVWIHLPFWYRTLADGRWIHQRCESCGVEPILYPHHRTEYCENGEYERREEAMKRPPAALLRRLKEIANEKDTT